MARNVEPGGGRAPGHDLYPHLLAPIRFGSLQLPNRVTMSAMGTQSGSASGLATERQVRYYAERARQGVALQVTELVRVPPGAAQVRPATRIDDDRFIPGLHALTDAVHEAGGLISVQLAQQGRAASGTLAGEAPVAPSAVALLGAEAPRALSEAEVAVVVQGFAAAAMRARAAGFDAIELHMAHGYLLQQFFSPYSNRRADRYGGSFENRARFPLEVLTVVRAAVGADFPVTCKLALDDPGAGGHTLDEGVRLAKRLEQAGISAITVAVGGSQLEALDVVPSMLHAHGLNAPRAEALKREVRVPVGVVGRITTPEEAEAILARGQADYIALGRALLADSEWVRKATEGRAEDICPCIGCMQGCFDRNQAALPITCLTNPRAGREADLPWTPAPESKRVLVVGGGVAGMQAAITAARRGHRVTLWERGSRLGGQWLAASAAPWKTADFSRYATYLAGQLERLDVQVVLGKEGSASAIADEAVDVVMLAAGATVRTPELPGDGSVPVVDVHAAWFEQPPPGEHIVVLGGQRTSWEAANWLLTHGKRVTLVVDGFEVGSDYGPQLRRETQRQLRDSEITVLLNGRLHSAVRGNVLIERDGVRDVVRDVDAVVVAGARMPSSALAQELEALRIPCIVVGDAREPRDAFRATHEAFIAAYDLE